MGLKQEVLDFIKGKRTNFNFEGGNSDDTNLSYANRENGDVGEDEHSEIDWEDGITLANALKKEFGKKIGVDLEPVDEWVILNITLK